MLRLTRTTFRLRRPMRASALIAAMAVLLAAVGGPLSQFVRLAEVVPPAKQAAAKTALRYRVVWGAENRPAQNGKKDAQHDGERKEQTPRVVKLLAGEWKAGSRVQAECSALPPVEPVAVERCSSWAPVAEAAEIPYRVDAPDNPPARGPPTVS